MELKIGNIRASSLVKEFKTPLYVYDQEKIEDTLLTFKKYFYSDKFATKILYASKAFQAIALLNILSKFGFGLDVVSQGELYSALKSNMAKDEIYFHGNNKSPAELNFAIVKSGISHIVVDNFMELKEIVKICQINKKNINVMLRLNVGIEAHTHEYIITSHVDSKFGMAFDSSELKKCLKLIEENSEVNLEGFHSHIGSQIFDMTAWHAAIDKLIGYLAQFDQPLSLNIGGGFGIPYTASDQPLEIRDVLKSLVKRVEEDLDKEKISLNSLMIEPGRSIVAEAGTTLYTVGYQKETPNKKYVFVDGGMGDNLRPSLYKAKYSCSLANKLNEEASDVVTIAGKYCESGDVLIESVELPKALAGDILAVYCTGAYGYSMASNYNRNPIPGVVFVKNGQAREVIKRQSMEDLIQGEIY